MWLIFHSKFENFKQFSKDNATNLFETFKLKNTVADKYSFIDVLYHK